MNAKRIAGILLPLKAISTRNLTSLGLVALFFFVYILAGGRISTMPKIDQSSAFGGARAGGDVAAPTVGGDIERIEVSPPTDRIFSRENKSVVEPRGSELSQQERDAAKEEDRLEKLRQRLSQSLERSQ